MEENENQFPEKSTTPFHGMTDKTRATIKHGSAEVNIAKDSSTLHVKGAEPVTVIGPERMSGKVKVKDLLAIHGMLKKGLGNQ